MSCSRFALVILTILALAFPVLAPPSAQAQRGTNPTSFADPIVAITKPATVYQPSPNYGDRTPGVTIDSVIMHTTEVDLPGTLAIFDNTNAQVSAHFTIAPDGEIYQHVATKHRAWHATYYNSRSIGIEMVGYANEPSTWNDDNLAALTDLLAWIVVAYPEIELIRPEGNAYDYPNNTFNAPGIVAHGQVQPWNRTDPGPYFPWDDVLSEAALKAIPEPVCAVAMASLGLVMRRHRGRHV